MIESLTGAQIKSTGTTRSQRCRPFKVTISHFGDDPVLALEGELGEFATPILTEYLEAALLLGDVNLILDLASLRAVADSGLDLLVRTEERLRFRGGALLLWAPSSSLHLLLDRAGLLACVALS